MKVLKTSIKGVVIIEPDLFKDSRGYFFERIDLNFVFLFKIMRVNLVLEYFVVCIFRNLLLLKVNWCVL